MSLMPPGLYRDYNSYLREEFGCRVQKISIDAGLTCPNRDGTIGHGGCIYCNDRGSGTGASRASMSITEQIRHGKAYLGRRYKASKFLGYFQSFTNTHAPLSVLQSLYEEALADEDIVGLTIGTRPDCLPDEVLDYLKFLKRRHSIWLEIGLQSAKEKTLKTIGRGHGVADFEAAVERARARAIPVCVHIILGLPGECREDMLLTARFLASRDIQAVKIHLLYVVRDTPLAEWHRRGEYVCLTRDEYVSIAGELLALLPPGVVIQRLTGDPHPEELVAPLWALEKQKNLQAIHTWMRQKELWQGKDFRG